MDLNKKTYLLITGASRGIGQEIAVQLASKVGEESVIVLVARSAEGLNKTKATIDSLGRPSLRVQVHCLDLAQAGESDFSELIADSLTCSNSRAEDYERAFIVHNVGSLGDVSKKAKDIACAEQWTKYYHLNVFSVISLNCEFIRAFAQPPKLIVNITSLCGIQPFDSMSMYCSGKAAREMYFKVLATEDEEEKQFVVVNYSPGAIDTDMTVELQQTIDNKALANQFKEMRDSNTILKTSQTIAKLVQVLEEKKFKSGDHVDYWD